jgi:hypothetical protein
MEKKRDEPKKLNSKKKWKKKIEENKQNFPVQNVISSLYFKHKISC